MEQLDLFRLKNGEAARRAAWSLFCFNLLKFREGLNPARISYLLKPKK